nr:Fic family protein [Listeria riparia]
MERIYLFSSGNGRTGRMIMNYLFAQQKLQDDQTIPK